MDYRPQWHFSPLEGWINDPNGLVFVDGMWHVFAQYAPDAVQAGPKHWLHATSRDLIHFEEHGIAVPVDDRLGEAFSGSAAVAPGFLGLNNPMVLMFTHHGRSEQQSLYYAEDHRHFVPYTGNPVITNTALKDFRDPKLLRNPVLGGWTAVIAAGDHAAFYHSNDLIRWEKTGEFGNHAALWGVYECPDVFPLPGPDGKMLWLLAASMSRPTEQGGSRTQYVLGEFDGRTFRETVPSDGPLVDQGFDSYAGVTFFGAKKPTMMAWASNWSYAGRQPTGAWRGQLGFARELSLLRTKEGPRLASAPVVVPDVPVQPAAHSGRIPLPWQHGRVRVTARGPFDLTLSNAAGDAFHTGLNADGYYLDRSRMQNAALYGDLFLKAAAPRLADGQVTLDLYLDACVCEVYADHGLYAATTLLYPKVPFDTLTVQGAEAVHISA